MTAVNWKKNIIGQEFWIARDGTIYCVRRVYGKADVRRNNVIVAEAPDIRTGKEWAERDYKRLRGRGALDNDLPRRFGFDQLAMLIVMLMVWFAGLPMALDFAVRHIGALGMVVAPFWPVWAWFWLF